MAIGAQDDERTVLGDPAQRHRIDRLLAQLAVLVIPATFDERKTAGVVSSTFVEDENPVPSINGKPTAKSSPTANLVDRFIILSAGWDEHFESVEPRDPTLYVGKPTEFFEFSVQESV